MKNVFINCSAKEFYEELKPVLLTLEGYTMYDDEWIPRNNGCRIQSTGEWFPFEYRVGYEDIDLADFIEAVKLPYPVKAYITVKDKEWRETVNLLKDAGLTVIDNFYDITVPVEEKDRAAKVLFEKQILYYISHQPRK